MFTSFFFAHPFSRFQYVSQYGQMHSYCYHVQKTNLKTRKVPSLEFLSWVQDTHRRLETKIQPLKMGARGPEINLFVLGLFSIENVQKIAKNTVFSIFFDLNLSLNPFNDFCSPDMTPLDTFHQFSNFQHIVGGFMGSFMGLILPKIGIYRYFRPWHHSKSMFKQY